MPDADPRPIALSLVSHTNVGKTTLARTLLGRDVGEVRDAPHVTEFADEHLLLRTAEGDELRLWDTPGFGDSARLARRMRQSGNPIGWFLSQVWDRWRDRAFWHSQQALRHVRDTSDVVLYLVNASEEPAAAAYVAPEMELLGWIGKPVIVLLNQLGPPRERSLEEAETGRWREHLATQPLVRAVWPMDAFARCWVQEAALLQSIEDALPPERRAAARRLADAWRARRRQTFDAAMASLAGTLGRIAATRIELDDEAGWLDRVRRAGSALGLGAAPAGAEERAQQALVKAMEAEVQAGTAELLRLHGIDGRAEGEILSRVATQVSVHRPVDEGKAAVLGGVLSGALAGLKADLATGGLTLGGGMLAGGLLGALGAAGIARGWNVVRGPGRSWVGWPDDALLPMVEAALLRYLAVAHFGRGRGEWAQGEAPPHWQAVVAEALLPHRDALQALWQRRSRQFDDAGEAALLATLLQPALAAAATAVLQRLYPDSAFGPNPANPFAAGALGREDRSASGAESRP